MVEVIINNKQVEGVSDRIKYVKQVNDLADVTTVNTSYSYSNDVPKTPPNTVLFEGLGLVGDTSTIPYKKNVTQIIDNGSMIVSNGVSTVKSTAGKYKLVIQDGIIDFFRAIENRTIGLDLDLSELAHTKTDVNIVASFTNPNYRYLISEYNGWTVKDAVLNPDYQVPSINNKYIFDKIMAYAGYTYEGLPDISIDWTTFPTPPTIPTDEEVLRFDGAVTGIYQNIGTLSNYVPTWTNVYTYDTAFLTLINNWKLKVLQTANYRADFGISGGRLLYTVLEGNTQYSLWMPLKMVLFKNNQFVDSVISPNDKSKLFTASANDVLHFYPVPLTKQEAEDAGIEDERFLNALEDGNFNNPFIDIPAFNAEIFTMGVEIFDFGEAFKDFGMTDFIKEILFRKSLTPFPDTNAKHIVFKTLSERLNTDNAIDWTSKYVKRTNEEYSFGSYAKVNNLLMKHDNEEDTFGNGSLNVYNDNLKDNITLYQSRYFSPNGNLVKIQGVFFEFFLEIKFWNRESKDVDGEQETEYKPLSNRFFLLREEIVNKSLTIGEIPVTTFPKASMFGTQISDVVNDYYGDWYKIFDNLRIHEIEVAVNQFDVNGLVMDQPYWFEQEGAFYLLNRLIYESGKLSKGEFLKIKN